MSAWLLLVLVAVLAFPAQAAATLSDSPDCETACIEAKRLRADGKPDDADKFLEKFTADVRACACALSGLAEESLVRGDLRGAADNYARASALEPDVAELALRAAEAALEAENVEAAAALLDRMTEPDESGMKARRACIAAKIALRRGDYARAAERMQSLKGDEEYCPYSDYLIGTAELGLGHYKAAREAWSRFVDDKDTPKFWADTAETRIETAYEYEGAGPLYELTLSAAQLYDSNASRGPDMARGLLRATPSPATRLGLAQRLTPLRTGRYMLRAELLADRTFYWFRHAREFSTTSLAGSAEGRIAWRGKNVEHRFSANYLFGMHLLDGGPRTESKSLYLYSQSHEGELKNVSEVLDNGDFTFAAVFGKRLYRHDARDALGLRLNVGMNFRFLEDALKLGVALRSLQEAAARKDYNREGLGLNVGLGWRALKQAEFSAAGGIMGISHTRDSESPSWDSHRRDTLFETGLRAAFGPFGPLRPSLDYELQYNQSTVAAFEYVRHVVSLNLEVGWSW